jgi:hypothetical protein
MASSSFRLSFALVRSASSSLIAADDAFALLLLVFASPDLLPTSSFDHNVFIHNPKLTFSEQKRTGSSTTAIKPIEDQLGLLGWALDRKGEKSQETVMGFWRKEEVEEGTEGGSVDGDDEELEEWLEVRVRFVKVGSVFPYVLKTVQPS